MEACIQADINFHLSIAQASGNEILADLYQAFSARLKSWFIQIYPDTSAFIQTNDLHQALFDSIKEGDEQKALTDANRIVSH